MTNRREFLLGAGAIAAGTTMAEGKDTEAERFVPHGKALKITGTFLDEITWDIPHQNWGYREWEQDFLNMKAIGIDTVILIRCGLDKFIAYPSEHLVAHGCHRPLVDLVEMFLTLADRHGMKFYFGSYCDRANKDFAARVDFNRKITEEAWERYGGHRSFAGWYLTDEITLKEADRAPFIRDLGRHCKDLSNGLSVLISPLMDGAKNVDQFSGEVRKADASGVEAHEKAWNDIFDCLKGAVDSVAFQDGHVDYHELEDYFEVNRKLTTKYGIQCWTNAETFDRDMPIKFLPIHFEKLMMKLEAAAKIGYDKAITFEFSHFMSPQSVYRAAGNLYRRYCECFDICPRDSK